MSTTRVAPEGSQKTAPSAAFAAVATLITLIGIVVAAKSGSSVNPLASGQLGLIQALPIAYFGGLALIVLAFVATLRRDRLIRPLLVFQLLALIVLLYGLASYTESVARLPTTWVHAGFIDFIQRTNSVFEGYDARFVWPGFFALGAMLNDLAGTTDQAPILTWAPLVFNLAYAVPVWTIIRSAGAPIRACWLGTAMFFLLNWVGQDYYSPQGLNELFALCFLAVIMRVFFSHSSLIPTWAKRTVEPFVRRRFPNISDRVEGLRLQAGGPQRLAISGAQKAALVGFLVLIYAASVVSHQLTPFFLIIVTAILVILDRLQVRVLPVIMVVGVFVWISYAATSFWAGQLSNLFGDVGNLSNVFGQNVENRVKGNPDHIPVIYGRLALAAGVWLLALIGFLRRVRGGRLDVLCIVGFLSPFAILGGQAYGGEAVLRVYLYGLPFVAALGAMALAPSIEKWSKATTGVVAVVLLALLPVFFISRYGNEVFENFSADEYATVQELNTIAPDNAKLVAINTLLPWRGERIETLYRSPSSSFITLEDTFATGDQEALVRQALLDRAKGEPSYLIVTRAQEQYAWTTQSVPLDTIPNLVNSLVASGDFKKVYENPDGVIIEPSDQK